MQLKKGWHKDRQILFRIYELAIQLLDHIPEGSHVVSVGQSSAWTVNMAKHISETKGHSRTFTPLPFSDKLMDTQDDPLSYRFLYSCFSEHIKTQCKTHFSGLKLDAKSIIKSRQMTYFIDSINGGNSLASAVYGTFTTCYNEEEKQQLGSTVSCIAFSLLGNGNKTVKQGLKIDSLPQIPYQGLEIDSVQQEIVLGLGSLEHPFRLVPSYFCNKLKRQHQRVDLNVSSRIQRHFKAYALSMS
jgi:hypothetical protein